MSTNPTASSTPSGGLGTLTNVLQMLGATGQLVGPRGALVTGNIGQGASAANTLYSGGQRLFGQPSAPTPEPTTMSAMGLTPEEFNRIPPEVRQELLRKLAGR